MSREEIERLLAMEPTIEPTPGFAVSVMKAVRRESEALEPIGFPWRRVLPGLVISAAGFVTGLALLVGALIDEPASGTTFAWTVPAWLGAGHLLPVAALIGSLLFAWIVVRLSGSARETIL